MNPLQDQLFKNAPNNWGVDRMKDVVLLRDKKTSERGDEVDYIELEDIESGSGRLLNKRNTLEVESAVTLFEKGDVLFGKLRPYLEKYFEADFNGKCTGEILAFQPTRIESGFLRFCVASPWFIQLATALAYGAKMPRANWTTQLAAFDVPLPPVDEQKRIAAYLDASCRAIDAAVAAKREQIATLDVLRECIIETEITGGLDGEKTFAEVEQDWIRTLPTHWEIVRIKRILARMDYGISESTEPDGKFPVLKMGNLQGGEIRFTKIEFVDSVESGLLLETDDILYNRTNSHDQVGKAAIFRGDRDDAVTFASYLVRLRANHRVLPAFLNYAVNSSGFLSFARKLAIPSVQQANLNSTRYGRLLIPLPPIEEQQSICDLLGVRLAKLKTVVDTLEEQIKTLTAYRKSLIHECVTGQRRITDEDVNRVTAHAASLA